MAHCDFLLATTPTTRQQLLEHCADVISDKPISLLARTYHLVLDEGSNEETNSSSSDASIRVMQWNVLADALGSGADNFIKCPQDAIDWHTRKIPLLQEILTYDPDIVCLQEVDHYSDFFNVQLERVGYVGTFKAKPDSPCLDCLHNNGPDGCALFYKSEKFSVVSKISPVLAVLDRGHVWHTNQVAIMVRLKCISSNHGKEFIVGTTHLKAKPKYHQLRYLQALNLLELIEEHAGADCPVIFGGDFNAEPSEKVYSAFETSKLALSSANKHLSADGSSEPLYTTWKIRPAGEMCHTIDYMWYSRNMFKPVRVLKFPTADEIGKNRLPSYMYPSDHLSLVSDFIFRC